MKYLLDTHALIWYFEESHRLPNKIKEMIKNPVNQVAISISSLWEITIKISLGKLNLDLPLNDFLDEMYYSDFEIIGIEVEHCKILGELAMMHKDPFDRIIISTAITEGCILISADENIKKYNDIVVLWD